MIASVMFGATVGNMQMMQLLIMAEARPQGYARILSVSQMVTTCANAAGPALLGFLCRGGRLRNRLSCDHIVAVARFCLSLAAGPVRALIELRRRLYYLESIDGSELALQLG